MQSQLPGANFPAQPDARSLSGSERWGPAHKAVPASGRAVQSQAPCPHQKGPGRLGVLGPEPSCDWGARPPWGGVSPAGPGHPGEGALLGLRNPTGDQPFARDLMFTAGETHPSLQGAGRGGTSCLPMALGPSEGKGGLEAEPVAPRGSEGTGWEDRGEPAAGSLGPGAPPWAAPASSPGISPGSGRSQRSEERGARGPQVHSPGSTWQDASWAGRLRSGGSRRGAGTYDGGNGGRPLLQLLQVQRLLGRGMRPGVARRGEETGARRQQPERGQSVMLAGGPGTGEGGDHQVPVWGLHPPSLAAHKTPRGPKAPPTPAQRPRSGSDMPQAAPDPEPMQRQGAEGMKVRVSSRDVRLCTPHRAGSGPCMEPRAPCLLGTGVGAPPFHQNVPRTRSLRTPGMEKLEARGPRTRMHTVRPARSRVSHTDTQRWHCTCREHEGCGACARSRARPGGLHAAHGAPPSGTLQGIPGCDPGACRGPVWRPRLPSGAAGSGPAPRAGHLRSHPGPGLGAHRGDPAPRSASGAPELAGGQAAGKGGGRAGSQMAAPRPLPKARGRGPVGKAPTVCCGHTMSHAQCRPRPLTWR